MINLKIARIKRGWTQQQLADEMEVARTDITRYETGRMKPTIDKLLLMAEVLGVSTDYLLNREVK